MITTHTPSSMKLFSGIALAILFFMLLIPFANAQTSGGGSTFPGGTSGSGSTFGSGGGQTITIPNPLGATSFEELIVRLNRWLLVIAAPILTLMIVIGAFQILTAAGNPENITKGRHTITYAVIGYALLLLSSGIVFIIRQVLGVQ